MAAGRSHLERAQAVTPGASQTRSKGPGAVGPALDAAHASAYTFPLFATAGDGCTLVDHNGRKYVDCFMSNAAVPLGYNYQPVVWAVAEALRSGSLLSLPHQQEAQVSERFLATCAPWAEQVRWVKSGTEAVMAAVRLARLATGRSRVVIMDSSYHGWSDFTDARYALEGQRNGVPPEVAELTTVLPYGQPLSLDLSTTAAVVIEPHRWQETDPRWLEHTKRVVEQAGAVLVYDEMVYGLRWANGGSAEYYGVPPHLACFGKALGNGIPVACVCGSRDLMAPAARYISGTYFSDTLALSAAGAVLREYAQGRVVERLWSVGNELWSAFYRYAPAGRDNVKLDGQAVHWRLVMPSPEQLDRVLTVAAERGVLVHRGSNNACVAMEPWQAEYAGRVLGEAAAEAS